MRYIHQLPGWPKLHWDDTAVLSILGEVRFRQGALIGRLSNLGDDSRLLANIEVQSSEIVASSAIEGEYFDIEDVRSSVAESLHGPLPSQRVVGEDVTGFANLMRDVTANFDRPLNPDRLCRWHRHLFQGERDFAVGRWRDSGSGAMRVVSGEIGGEAKVHFEAPPAEKVGEEMDEFFNWFENVRLDPTLLAAIAHLRFLTIHPFEDGNGRIARAISEYTLARADQSSQRFYSLSTQIEKERATYYLELESAQKGHLDITDWIEWFLKCLDRALIASDSILDGALQHERIRKRLEEVRANSRQSKIVGRLLDDFRGNLTSSKYAKLAKCSQDTAIRDIKGLIDFGILIASGAGGRSRSYRLAGKK